MTANWLQRINPQITLAGDQDASGPWLEPLRVIYDHELVIFSGGPFEVEIDSQKYNCPDGHFIIVPPGKQQLATLESGKSGHRRWIHFDWAYQGPRNTSAILTYLPAKAQLDAVRHPPGFIPKRVLRGPIEDFHRACELYSQTKHLFASSQSHDKLLARAKLLELLTELLDTGDKRSHSEKTSPHELPHRVKTALDELAHIPLAEMPSLQSTLQRLGHSYGHLMRVFKQAYGLAPVQYINTVRIERARQLIQEADWPLKEIARHVGYDSAAYFCRQFRRQCGYSPSEFASISRQKKTGRK